VLEILSLSFIISVRIQKARGSFSKLREVWLSTSIRNDTKIRIFNASLNLYFCVDVKHGLLEVKFGVKTKLLLIDV
jgi:hypothetical protein